MLSIQSVLIGAILNANWKKVNHSSSHPILLSHTVMMAYYKQYCGGIAQAIYKAWFPAQQSNNTEIPSLFKIKLGKDNNNISCF